MSKSTGDVTRGIQEEAGDLRPSQQVTCGGGRRQSASDL